MDRIHKIDHTNNQHGNVLFIILIAVALFAALSYAVTKSGGGSAKDINDEQAKLYASQMMQYATQIKNGISRIQILHSCEDIQISFERPPFDGSDTIYVNANSPANFKCHVFHPSGGAISYVEPPQDIFIEYGDFEDTAGDEFRKYIFTGIGGITGVGTDCPTTGDCNELLLTAPSISEKVCLEILKSKGEDTIPSDSLPHYHSQLYALTTFNGYRANAGHADFWVVGANALSATALRGSYYGCYQTHQSSGTYHYYHVLIAR